MFACEYGILITITQLKIFFVKVGAKNEQKSIIFDEQNMDTTFLDQQFGPLK